jgi:hypothetical protein
MCDFEECERSQRNRVNENENPAAPRWGSRSHNERRDHRGGPRKIDRDQTSRAQPAAGIGKLQRYEYRGCNCEYDRAEQTWPEPGFGLLHAANADSGQRKNDQCQPGGSFEDDFNPEDLLHVAYPEMSGRGAAKQIELGSM